jgi:hypothetical protein
MGLGSGIRDPEKTYSGSRIQGVKKAPDPGSGSARLPEDVGGLGARHQAAGLGNARGRLQLVARQHPRPDTRISEI